MSNANRREAEKELFYRYAVFKKRDFGQKKKKNTLKVHFFAKIFAYIK
jgi:hypothetical protein